MGRAERDIRGEEEEGEGEGEMRSFTDDIEDRKEGEKERMKGT